MDVVLNDAMKIQDEISSENRQLNTESILALLKMLRSHSVFPQFNPEEKRICLKCVFDLLLDDPKSYFVKLYFNSIISRKENSLSNLKTVNQFFIDCDAWMNIIYPVMIDCVHKIVDYIFENRKSAELNLRFVKSAFAEFDLSIFVLEESAKKELCKYADFAIHDAFVGHSLQRLIDNILNGKENKVFLSNLQDCVKFKDLRFKLSESFNKMVFESILKPEYETADLLLFCNSCMKIFNIIDSSCAIATNICRYIMDYILKRKDLVKCIVDCLCFDRLKNINYFAQKKYLFETQHGCKKEAQMEIFRQKTLSLFEMIDNYMCNYGNASDFVDEFRKNLANRLLKNYHKMDLNYEKECVDVLNKCFGKDLVKKCVVMINDISKPAETYSSFGLSTEESNIKFSVLMLNPSVWPISDDEYVFLPEYLKYFMKWYKENYERKYRRKTIQWISNYDILELDLCVDNVNKKLYCSPNQAFVLFMFKNHIVLTIHDIKSNSKLSSNQIEKIITFWVDSCIINHLGDGKYQLTHTLDDN